MNHMHTTAMNHDGHDQPGHSMSMQMYFTTSCEVTILFESWKTTTCTELFGSCVVVLLAGVVFEGIRFFRRYLDTVLSRKLLLLREDSPSSTSALTHPDGHHVAVSSPKSRKWLKEKFHIMQSSLYLLQILLGYLLMLVAMTFNVWLYLCVCLGAVLGHLAFYFSDVFSEDVPFPTNKSNQPRESSHCHCG